MVEEGIDSKNRFIKRRGFAVRGTGYDARERSARRRIAAALAFPHGWQSPNWQERAEAGRLVSRQPSPPARRGRSVSLSILYEDNHLLVVNKPAGLPTQGALPDVPSLHTIGCEYLRRKYQKPGNVYLGIVMRLDACTSGVVVLARTSKAAARLSSQFRERETHKVYWAVVEGAPEAEQGEYVDWVAKDERQQRMRVVRCDGPAAQMARLQYRVLHRLSGGRTLLAVTLDTGRKHQIRLQMAARGTPILGDSKYGSEASFAPPGIALHAARLDLRHPVKQDELRFQAPLPSTWDALGIPEASRNALRRAES